MHTYAYFRNIPTPHAGPSAAAPPPPGPLCGRPQALCGGPRPAADLPELGESQGISESRGFNEH